MRTILLALALLWALPVSAQDTIPVPWPVAVGGVSYSVQVDGVEVSTHSTEYGALRRAGLEAVDCAWTCDVRVGLVQEWRIDRIEVVRAPAEPEPEPEPDPEWSADSVTVYPAGVEPSDSLRVTNLHWASGTSYSCVTIADEIGYAEARPQEVEGIPYWIVIPGDPDWVPPPTIDGWESVGCAPSMATLAELPTEDQAAYRVGLLADLPPEPIPVSPVVEYANSTLTATWEPSPSEWVDRYTITYGAQDGTGTTGAWTTATEYTVSTAITAGWICVRASRGGELSGQRCNSWDTGGG